MSYERKLTFNLRLRGLCEAEIAEAVDEVRAHEAAAGTPAEAEFGTAEEYATQFPKKKRRTRGRTITTIGATLAIAYALFAVLLALLALLQLQLPAPRGLLNDFAGVVTPDRAARIEALAQEVRDKSAGEIAVVVLPDLQGQAPGDVALRIGREWKVGSAARIGDRTRNTGTVILLSPRETNSAPSRRIAAAVSGGSKLKTSNGPTAGSSVSLK